MCGGQMRKEKVNLTNNAYSAKLEPPYFMDLAARNQGFGRDAITLTFLESSSIFC